MSASQWPSVDREYTLNIRDHSSPYPIRLLVAIKAGLKGGNSAPCEVLVRPVHHLRSEPQVAKLAKRRLQLQQPPAEQLNGQLRVVDSNWSTSAQQVLNKCSTSAQQVLNSPARGRVVTRTRNQSVTAPSAAEWSHA
eukprot:1182443-Prorocentrum_minimum.AAC.7